MGKAVFNWDNIRYTTEFIISYKHIVIKYATSEPDKPEVKHFISIRYSCAIKFDATGSNIFVRNIKCDSLDDAQCLLHRIDKCYDHVIGEDEELPRDYYRIVKES